jgi:DNA-binding NarL/FixJ family response regulator
LAARTAEAADESELRAAVTAEPPSVVLLNLDLGSGAGGRVYRDLRAHFAAGPVAVIAISSARWRFGTLAPLSRPSADAPLPQVAEAHHLIRRLAAGLGIRDAPDLPSRTGGLVVAPVPL